MSYNQSFEIQRNRKYTGIVNKVDAQMGYLELWYLSIALGVTLPNIKVKEKEEKELEEEYKRVQGKNRQQQSYWT